MMLLAVGYRYGNICMTEINTSSSQICRFANCTFLYKIANIQYLANKILLKIDNLKQFLE